MRCSGLWRRGEDGIVRPVIVTEISGLDDARWTVEFLVDTGADRTVISADVLNLSGLPHARPVDRIGGVGGFIDSVDVTTRICLECDDGHRVTLRGTYSACLQSEALDMSVLGRDILNMFAVIVNRAADRVVLLHGADGYLIQHR